MLRSGLLVSCLALSGCASPSMQGLLSPTGEAGRAADAALPAPEEVTTETLDPTPPPPPPPEARTADQFDTTSDEDRAEALTAPGDDGAERALGTTIASLGDPTDPGIWLKTPLVTELTQGRVENPATGKTITLELRPSGGEAGAGSQISLPALRLLEIPLTELPELAVFAG